MARPSKLTDQQWNEIIERNLRGESMRALAKEFKVTEGAVRNKITTQASEIKTVVNQTLEAEKRFNLLPVSAQVIAQSLTDDLRAISTHLASAAKYGSMTAHRLAGIAHNQVDKIDEANIDASMEVITNIAKLTDTANRSAQTGLNLIAANKEATKSAGSAPSGLNHFYGDSD